MNQAIQDFIDCKRIAVVGVSHSSQKFGNTAFAELKSRGYQVYPVTPTATQIAGERCYPNLSASKGQIDGVLIIVPSTHAMQVLREAASLGLTKIWLQQGAESPETLALATDLGFSLVSGKCILMYAPPVRSFHG